MLQLVGLIRLTQILEMFVKAIFDEPTERTNWPSSQQNLNVNEDVFGTQVEQQLQDGTVYALCVSCFSDKNSPKRVKIEKEIYEIDKFIKDSFAHDLKMEEEKAIRAIKKNNKFFYSYAKKKSKTKVTIGPLMDNNKWHILIGNPGMYQ